MNTPDALEEGYKIALWKDDPWSPEGRERYNSALRKFKRLTEHPWLKNILSKEKVSLLDLGAGKGIGGVALAKTLKQHGMEVDLTMVDLRKSAVQDGLRFAHEEGVKAEAFQMNAIEAHKLGKFDIVLMYGAILTHFDSWNMPRLFASSAKSLKEDGIIVIEEFDRVHRIFTSGFKDFIIENPKPEELSISIHVGYDLIRGSYKRSFIRMRDWKSVMLPINFRSISTIASTLWFFTKDVDIVSTGINGVYVVLGKGARRLLEPEHLAENPTVLQRGNPWDSSIKKG